MMKTDKDHISPEETQKRATKIGIELSPDKILQATREYNETIDFGKEIYKYASEIMGIPGKTIILAFSMAITLALENSKEEIENLMIDLDGVEAMVNVMKLKLITRTFREGKI